MTARQLIYRAARSLGYLRAGMNMGADLESDGLAVLNDMIDEWLTDRLLVYAIQQDVYTLTANTQQYTIGPGLATPNFNAARPTRIEEANLVLNTFTPAIRQPLEILRDAGLWANIRIRTLGGAIPRYLYYQPTSPSGTLNIWPGPLSNYQIELFTWLQLQSFADITTSYTFPPGYANMLRWNLAVALATMLPRAQMDLEKILPLVQQRALESRAAVEAHNAPELLMVADPALLHGAGSGTFNYLSGNTVRA